ncbi:cyclic nucleotide-binding domain-containing protein [Pedobacter nyackensis]|uniref:cAMP-binding domain of CRP or a regulatory subunit of cAMP-dependent protein kinases n=1 Tax=Pedobacter nyackensis TaxID=475255 RepID=A0A1W2EFK5_9SPHI|nr:hypothetical protein [Pedobacter nyackensis]SMD08435.1 hypothetical protein SAMN04488101_11225 [Pedobacter nyackensis]
MNFDNLPTSNITSGSHLTSTNTHEEQLMFINEGYAVEYSSISEPRKVISFIGPKEFALRTTSESEIITLTDVTLVGISKPNLKSLLREFEEVRQFYRVFKKKHLDKIAKNRNELKTFTSAERYISLLETYPWVKEIASPDDIQSYLNVPSGYYTKMCAVE